MNWLLPYIFSFFAFVVTLYFIRLAGKFIQQFIPKNHTVTWDNLKITLVRSTPTIFFAVLILILRNNFGWIWISAGAVWLSLIWDGIHLISVFHYVLKLRKFRRRPESFFYQVRVEPYDKWSDPNILNISPLKFWLRGHSLPTLLQPLSFIFTLFGGGKPTLGILYGDFQKFLRNDYRYVDVFDDIEDKLGFDTEKLWEIPHLAVKDIDAYKREMFGFLGILGNIAKDTIKEQAGQEEDAGKRQELEDVLKAVAENENESNISKQSSRSSSKPFLLNRTVNTALPAELWETSCRLIEKTPTIIAATWKLYHFQEDIRLRLVTLFNAADMIQRFMGAIILQILRETGELEFLLEQTDFPRNKKDQLVFPPNTNGEWNRVMVWVLKNSKNEDLEIFRQILLKPHTDFTAMVENLAPFWKILQTTPQIPATEQNTLAYFSIISQLRNKTVGHGAIGWKLQLRPAIYLSALHFFFLNAMREVSKLDLGVIAYREVAEDVEIISFIQGLTITEKPEGEYQVAVKNPANGDGLDLYPYLRFYNGRLL